jgi:two-component system chemotaxis sensor kinase CheA
MRSKKLARQMKKAFENNLDESTFPQLLEWIQTLPAGPEKESLHELVAGLPELFCQVEQTYSQSDERVEMAQRSLEVSSRELTEVNRHLFSLNQTFDAMVNSLGQGFFLFTKEGKCLPVYSKVCDTLLETTPSGRCVSEVLKVPFEKQAGFLDWCSMLFEELLEFDELAPLGPKFFAHSEKKVVALEYRPVRSGTGEIEAVVVIATDRTKEVEASKKAFELQAYATLVVSILKDRPRFSQFVRHSREFFAEIRTVLRNEDFNAQGCNLIKRHLHTLKGAAATFGMEHVKDFAHEIETNLQNFHGFSAQKTYLKGATVQLEVLFETLLSENKEIIGDIFQGASATREITVDALETFALRLKDLGSANGLYQSFVQGILCIPLWDNFNQFIPVVESTAAKTRKKVSPVVCLGDNPPLYPEAYEHVWESLSHLFRNLVDHGIESSLDRRKLGKSESGQIFIRCRELELHEKKWIEIQISDDGKGIDAEGIRRKLISRKDPQAQTLNKEELLNKIFEPGFSTATTVTEISGRGVGMDIVRAAIEEMQGSITVESALNKGTTFFIRLPLIQNPGWKLLPTAQSAPVPVSAA